MIDRALIVLASAHDAPARALAQRWSRAGGTLVTPAALSVEGWRYVPGDAASLRAPIGGRTLSVGDIGGVVVRLPCVTAADLPHIAPADRDYVAEEMTAFLLAWLTELPCRVVNRPSATCLAGPALRDEQWVRLACGLGIPSRPTIRRVPVDDLDAGEPVPAPTSVTVVGARALTGAADPILGRRACALAAAAGVDVLTVHFDAPAAAGRLVGADLWVEVTREDVADALLAVVTETAAPAPRAVEAGR